jgi:hypothetical protein
MEHTTLPGHRIWCPFCNHQRSFLQVPNAARLFGVDRRTIYRHIEDGSVYVFRLGGNGRYRICSGCLQGSAIVRDEKNQDLREIALGKKV